MQRISQNKSILKGLLSNFLGKYLDFKSSSINSTHTIKESYRKHFFLLMLWLGSFSFFANLAVKKIADTPSVKSGMVQAVVATSPFLILFDNRLNRNVRANIVIQFIRRKFARHPMGIAPGRTFFAPYRFGIAPLRKITARARSDPVPVKV